MRERGIKKALPAPLKVKLSASEDRELLQMKQAAEIPQRVRERAEMVRLNGYGWSVSQIAKYMKKCPHTVRDSLHRFKELGMEGLWNSVGRGRKPRWTPADIEYLEECLSQEQCTYNSQQLSQKLATERGVELSADRLRKLLKKRGGVVKEPDISNALVQSQKSNKRSKQT